jgi:uncharacterized membrane protein
MAEQKYTIVSEIIYGFFIIIALYSFFKLLGRWNIQVNWRFCLALLPYIIYGSISRVFEDSGFFNEPFVYWFVTPLIYVQIIILVLIFLIIGYSIEKNIQNKYLTINNILFLGGIFILLLLLTFSLNKIINNQWYIGQDIRFDFLFLIIFLIFFISLIICSISQLFKKNKRIKLYSDSLNLAMIGGHLLDGITSYISVYDPFNMGLPKYIEIHPASNFIMEIWPPLYPIIKLFLIIFIIYLFDVYYREELFEYQRFINLLKIGIFILGFAPGLRDLIRVVMGV